MTLLLPNPGGRFPARRGERSGDARPARPGRPALAGVRGRCCSRCANLAGGPDARRLDDVPAVDPRRRRPRDRRRRAGRHAVDGDRPARTTRRPAAGGSCGREPWGRSAGRPVSTLSRIDDRAAARLLRPPAGRRRPRGRRGDRARARPPAAHARDDRVRELRARRPCSSARARCSRTSTPRAIRASATTAAASTSTSSSSSRSTARRRCSAPSTPTSSRTPARRPTPPSTTRCWTRATRSWASRSPHGGHLTHGMKINVSGRLYDIAPYEVDRETQPDRHGRGRADRQGAPARS